MNTRAILIHPWISDPTSRPRYDHFVPLLSTNPPHSYTYLNVTKGCFPPYRSIVNHCVWSLLTGVSSSNFSDLHRTYQLLIPNSICCYNSFSNPCLMDIHHLLQKYIWNDNLLFVTFNELLGRCVFFLNFFYYIFLKNINFSYIKEFGKWYYKFIHKMWLCKSRTQINLPFQQIFLTPPKVNSMLRCPHEKVITNPLVNNLRWPPPDFPYFLHLCVTF